MNVVFLGMACVLTVASLYWTFGRGTPRPAGTWAMGSLLASFALAFSSYAPLFAHTLETLVPHAARLLSNSASLAAATSVLALSFQVNLESAEARRRIRIRMRLLAAAIACMTALFAVEQSTGRSPHVHAIYSLVYIAYLGFAVVEFLRQVLRQSTATGRSSVKVGLRIAATGCAFAMVYVAYKVTGLVSLMFGLGLIPVHGKCSSLVASTCAFSVASPALAVLLICLGLTLPAVVYPIRESLRRRWEKRSLEKLGPLWQDLSAAMPEIVLPAEDVDDGDFLLQRRVIEISDGILALRAYSSRQVQEAAERSIGIGTQAAAAIVEATVVKGALTSMREGRRPEETAALPGGFGADRRDLRAETEWLLQVTHAYKNRPLPRVADDGLPYSVGA
ncbi:MAB_1171c family putative transporter [Streptomyces sp. NPDC057287]|uniref:MAB_1171c family putative transporter n=1 Tax=Streptomyces sp. NPDC057287 TaxID=3346086 RepID=UPI00363325FA